MKKTIYGIYEQDIVFTSLEDAEYYLINQFPEHCGNKDAALDFCEQMIWEDVA